MSIDRRRDFQYAKTWIARNTTRGIALMATATTVLSGCAPVSESVRYRDDWVKERTVSGEGTDRSVSASVRYRADGASITVLSHQTCTRQVEDLFHRTQITERHADPTATWLLYGAGGLGVGIGALVLSGPSKTTPPYGYSANTNTVSPAATRATGGVFLGLGVVALAAAIATSLRARDEVVKLGTVTVVRPGSQSELSCNVKPVFGRDVLLTTSSSTDIPIGGTDRQGHLDLKWNALRSLFVEGEPVASGTLSVVRVGTAGNIDLALARTYWAGRELAEAKRLAAGDNVDRAKIEMNTAAKLGADVSDVEAAIEVAPTSVIRAREAEQQAQVERAAAAAAKAKEIEGHLARARQLISASDPAQAHDELDAAAALGADVDSLAEKVTKLSSAKAVAQWKKHLVQCRKVSDARSKIEKVSYCDDECQRIKKRVDDDWERLGTEKLDVDGLPSSQRNTFVDMCQRAGCPECPEGTAAPSEAE
jgi:hypothetical protein